MFGLAGKQLHGQKTRRSKVFQLKDKRIAFVTSRKPDDLEAFNSKLIEEFADGVHEGQRESAAAH